MPFILHYNYFYDTSLMCEPLPYSHAVEMKSGMCHLYEVYMIKTKNFMPSDLHITKLCPLNIAIKIVFVHIKCY